MRQFHGQLQELLSQELSWPVDDQRFATGVNPQQQQAAHDADLVAWPARERQLAVAEVRVPDGTPCWGSAAANQVQQLPVQLRRQVELVGALVGPLGWDLAPRLAVLGPTQSLPSRSVRSREGCTVCIGMQ
jgi:hypothetical protein